MTYNDFVSVAVSLPVPGAVLLVCDPLGQPEVCPGHVPGPLHLEAAPLTHPHIVT